MLYAEFHWLIETWAVISQHVSNFICPALQLWLNVLQLTAFILESPAEAVGFVYQLSHQSLGGSETGVAFMSIPVPQ